MRKDLEKLEEVVDVGGGVGDGVGFGKERDD